jgi:hypothetical protein
MRTFQNCFDTSVQFNRNAAFIDDGYKEVAPNGAIVVG